MMKKFIHKILPSIRRAGFGLNNCDGMSIVEMLISLTLLALVIVSILNGFSQQQLNAKKNEQKNNALVLAQMRIEEYLVFSSRQLSNTTVTDYISYKDGVFSYYDSDPKSVWQYRRVTNVFVNNLKTMATITVRVDYGAVIEEGQSELKYPFQVSLNTQRGI